MAGNCTTVIVEGREVRTLRDILPETRGLRLLFVAKVPTPKSVAACHYFQGKHGKMFWNRLREYEILNPTTEFEDDSLLDHGFGIVDIVKVPRGYRDEPSPAEYLAGIGRVLETISRHQPA